MKKRFLVLNMVLCICIGMPVFGEKILTPRPLYNAMPKGLISLQNDSGELPARVDIGSRYLIPRSQGSLGACASWTTAQEVSRYERIRNSWPVGKNSSYFSPLYLYNQVNGGADNGSSFYSNLSILVDKGCALYVTFPYIIDYHIQPGLSANREAARYKIAEFKTLPREDPEIYKLWLASGYGILATFKVYENFDTYSGGLYRQAGHEGVNRDGQWFMYHGGLVIGYDDATRTFRAINSWGTSWGDKGFFTFSYEDLPNLVVESHVIIPKPELPTDAVAPSYVEASRGANRGRVIVSWEKNQADEYEVFRLDEGELYKSLGTVKENFFEDRNVEKDRHYFYFVAAHKNELMSELSLAVEGWAGAGNNAVPGIPQRFQVSRNGDWLNASWWPVENTDKYEVYQSQDGRFVLAAETDKTSVRIPLPHDSDEPTLTYFVIACNDYGSSLNSEPAFISLEDWKKLPDEENAEKENAKEYRGRFYQATNFYDLERDYREKFLERIKKYEINLDSRIKRLNSFFGGRK
jgi:hypothetical protein